MFDLRVLHVFTRIIISMSNKVIENIIVALYLEKVTSSC